MADCKQVMKYGQKLREFRYMDATAELRLLTTVLGETLVERLWFDGFEPKAGALGAEELAEGFLRFLDTDRAARRLVRSKAPPYAGELVRYLALESSMANHWDRWMARPVPENSVLAHAGFALQRFDYDVPEFVRNPKRRRPRRRPTKYLLVVGERYALPSVFEIDEEAFTFLERQVSGLGEGTERPKIYAELLKLGLVG